MKTSAKILIVDDDNYVMLSMRILLEQHYTDVRGINNPMQIESAINETEFNLVLLDMNFRSGDTDGQAGLDIIKTIKAKSPQTSVICITAYGEIQLAVEAIKRGAFDFMVKPWQNEKLISTVAAGLKLNESFQQVEKLTSQKEELTSLLQEPYNDMIGECEAMQRVLFQIEKVAQTDANVLITGENGTGKELVARAIHNRSLRQKNIFMSVDMGAISETLFESELFGHKKGAFTDAKSDRIGKFEAANDGTIFLDEIGNLSLSLQAKLLRVIQDQKVTQVGSNQAKEINARLICATNAILDKEVQEGNFRQDLLFRINTIEIKLPPLRDRLDDIPLLADHFFQKFKQKYQKTGLFIKDGIYQNLKKYDWPGNIRELQHTIERAVIMSDGKQLQVGDLMLERTNQTEQEQFENFNLEGIEKWAIESAIKKHQGNISYAAQELGLSRGALYRRMEKYEI